MTSFHTSTVPGVHAAAILHPQPASTDSDRARARPPLAEFGDRLVRLSNGRTGLRGGLGVQVELPAVASGRAGGPSPAAPAPADPAPPRAIIDFIASNETLDRSDEILLATGWQLENYRRNPVFQNAHQYGDVIFTLGRALITEVRPGPSGEQCLFQRIEFAVEANPMARIAYRLYQGKFLNAVSVGFIPLRWENGSAEAGYRRKYLEMELLEVSAVGIPANPDALQLGYKSGVIDRADLRELADLCLRTLSSESSRISDPQPPVPHSAPDEGGSTPNPQRISTAAPGTRTGALGARSNEAHLRQLAGALRDLLRRT